jgi:hypothetical protein
VSAFAEDVVEQRDRLLVRLAEQRERVSKLWAWYRGRQELPDVPAKYQTAYRLFLEESATPWARLVVDAIAERLRVQGFRSPDAETGANAWRAFTRSRLNADQRLVYTEALIGGTGYVSVAAAPDGEVFIVPESSFEVTHEPDLTDRAVVAGALKLYPLSWAARDWVVELYRPEATYRWLAELDRAPSREGGFPIDEVRVAKRLEWESTGEPTPNEHGVVPVIPFENRVNVLSGGASEIEDCVPVLRRIDRLTLDKMITSHFASFRQKWATGLVVPTDPETGQRVEPYKAAVDRLWVNTAPDGRFGTFEATDVSQYLSAVDSEIATLAAISRVPAHYLMQRNLANPPSAESLIASEAGLISKVEDRQAQYGEAWEQAAALQARLSGRPIEIDSIEVDWVNAERRNPAQTSDAAIKLQNIGVPQPALWAYVGFTPQQVEEFSRESAAQALIAAATTPTPLAPAVEPPA